MKVFKSLIVLLFVLFASVSFGETRIATWEYSDVVDGFTIWEMTAPDTTQPVITVAGDVRQVSIDVDFSTMECKNYVLTAFIGNAHSDYAHAVVCPEFSLPPMVIRPGAVINFSIQVE